MENQIINKIKKIKKEVKKIYNNETKYIDVGNNRMIDSDTLNKLYLLSKIDEELTDVMYNIFDIKNSKKA